MREKYEEFGKKFRVTDVYIDNFEAGKIIKIILGQKFYKVKKMRSKK